mgnify:FL=1
MNAQNKIRITEKDGIFFTEAKLESVKNTFHINQKLDGILGDAMLKNLSDLKAVMAKIAKSHDCNLIHSFVYRQKSELTFRALFGTDDVYWEGAGICTKLSGPELQEMLDNSL